MKDTKKFISPGALVILKKIVEHSFIFILSNLKKPSIYFPTDNQVPAANVRLYQLIIFTGLQRSTSKSFKIYIRLIGDKCHDTSHCLNMNLPNLFQRGSVNQFLLTSFIDIGRRLSIND